MLLLLILRLLIKESADFDILVPILNNGNYLLESWSVPWIFDAINMGLHLLTQDALEINIFKLVVRYGVLNFWIILQDWAGLNNASSLFDLLFLTNII